MKLNFEAIAERVSPDDIIGMIIGEVSEKYGLSDKKAEKAEKETKDKKKAKSGK